MQKMSGLNLIRQERLSEKKKKTSKKYSISKSHVDHKPSLKEEQNSKVVFLIIKIRLTSERNNSKKTVSFMKRETNAMI